MENASAIPQPMLEGQKGRSRRRHHFTGPIVLIAIGLVFLGQNLGFLPSDTWLNLWQFWPVLLILVGIELILGHSGIGSAIASILMIVAILGLVATVAFFGQIGYQGFSGVHIGAAGPFQTNHVTQEIGNAQRGIIDLEHGAGRLEVSALPLESAQLLEGDLAYSENSALERRAESRGDGTYVRLGARNSYNGFPFGNSFRQDWTVRLSPNVPLDVRVHSGASAVSMDLSQLKVTNLNVDSGASGVDITLPSNAGQTQAFVKAGVAGVHVRIPEGVSARIRIQNGLSGSTVDTARFPKNGNYYQSPDYESATNKVDLRLETGVSGVTIN